MLINEYVALQMFKSQQNELHPRSGIRRAVAEIISEYKDQKRRDNQKPRK